MKRRLPAAVLLTGLAACGGSPAASPSPLGSGPPPALVTPTGSPSALATPAVTNPRMAYDEADQLTVLFGTAPDGSPATFTWDGSNWAQQHPHNSPPASTGASLVYDVAHQNLVLFGGAVKGTATADTWIWKDGNWTKQHPATSPPARSQAAAAYDPKRGEVVLFGGCCSGQQFAPTPLGDTWSWNGSTWTEDKPSTSPGPRQGSSMVADPALETLLLYGGMVQGSGTESSEMWTWDGSNWSQRHPAARPASDATFLALAPEIHTRHVLLFAGYPGGGQTWTWDGHTFKREVNAQPAAGSSWVMAYDAARDRVVLFDLPSGSSAAATWLWDGRAWTRAA